MDTALTRPLPPQEQAERERLQRILDDLNGQIDSIVAKMEADIAAAMRIATQKSLRPALRMTGARGITADGQRVR